MVRKGGLEPPGDWTARPIWQAIPDRAKNESGGNDPNVPNDLIGLLRGALNGDLQLNASRIADDGDEPDAADPGVLDHP